MRLTSQLLEAYLHCPTKCWLRSVGERITDSTHVSFTHAQNESFHTAAIQRLLSNAHQNEWIPSPSPVSLIAGEWRLAIRVLAQSQHLESCLHAVERLSSKGRGKPGQFVPIRFAPSNRISKNQKLLLAFDALALSEMLGREVPLGKMIHGDNYSSLNLTVSTLLPQVRGHIAKMSSLLASSSQPDLIMIPHCAECEFQTRCRQKAVEKDDLSLLSRMTEKERKKLHDKGIFTVTQLSYTFRPRRRPQRLHNKREPYHHSLKALAIRQKKIHIVGSPEMTIEGTPVYLDVEGIPDRDFYYLIGVRFGSRDSVEQYSLWADGIDDEKKLIFARIPMNAFHAFGLSGMSRWRPS